LRHHIEKDHVERRAAGNFERFPAVARQDHPMTFLTKRPLQQFGHTLLVFDDQNLHLP
jgi:hypothetical protein